MEGCTVVVMKSPGAATSIKIDSLYFLKALCALFVVIIHSEMWGRETIEPIIRIAVPCFFAISGFFLYSEKQDVEFLRIYRWLKKVALIYLFVALYYGVFLYFYEGKTYTWKDVVISLVIGTTPVFHLWYLVSLLQALIVVLLLKRFHVWGVWPLFLVFILEYMFRSCLAHKIIDNLYLNSWKPLWAVLLLGIGYYSSKYKTFLYSTKILILFLLISILLQYNICCFSPDIARLLGMVCNMIIPVCLISLCVKFPEFTLSYLTRIGKEHSGNIYYFHVFVYLLLNKIIAADIGCKFPLLTFIVSVLFSEFIHFMLFLYNKFHRCSVQHL